VSRRRAALERHLASETARPLEGGAAFWADQFRSWPGVAAVLFYGSGLWKPDQADAVYDFYLLAHCFRDLEGNPLLAAAGRLLPPNVRYLEADDENGTTRRCKYNVLRVSQFLSAAKGRSLTPHVWARFCQPCRLAYADSEALRRQIIEALAEATLRFHRRALLFAEREPIEKFWARGLRSTYADEIRSERPEGIESLVRASSEALVARSRLALPALGPGAGLDPEGRSLGPRCSPFARKARRLGLRCLRPLRKGVVLARFCKAAFTFRGGLEYACWKISRHSGVALDLTDYQRRHPWIGAPALLLKILRRRAMR